MAFPAPHHAQQPQGVPSALCNRPIGKSKRTWPTPLPPPSQLSPISPASTREPGQGSKFALQPLSLEDGLASFVDELTSRNLSELTISAYYADLRQLLAFLHATDITVRFCHQIERSTLVGFLADLARSGRSGVTRARKLASIREFYSFLQRERVVQVSPAASISMRLSSGARRRRAPGGGGI